MIRPLLTGAAAGLALAFRYPPPPRSTLRRRAKLAAAVLKGEPVITGVAFQGGGTIEPIYDRTLHVDGCHFAAAGADPVDIETIRAHMRHVERMNP